MKLIQFRSPDMTPAPAPAAAPASSRERSVKVAVRALQTSVLRRVVSGQRYLRISAEAHRGLCASRARARLLGAGPVFGETNGRHLALGVTPIGGPAGYGSVAFPDLLEDADGRRIALLGGPGAGKTTLMWLAARRIAESGAHRPIVPVVLHLRSFRGAARKVGLHGIIAHLVARALKEISAPTFDWTRNDFLRAAANGWCVFLLDGLDEIDSDDARVVVSAIASLSRDHSGCRFVLTSRTAAYRTPVELREFKRFEIQPVDPLGEEASDYLSGIESVRDQLRGFRQMLEFEAPIRRALSTPLRLLLAALVYRDKREAIPEARLDLYRDALRGFAAAEKRRTPQELVSQWLMLAPEACLRSLAVLAVKARDEAGTRS